MAIDNKYGKVILEKGSVGEDEPVFIFRAKDKLLPKVLAYYHLFCLKEGSPKKHLDLILEGRDGIIQWQMNNETKIPDSKEHILKHDLNNSPSYEHLQGTPKGSHLGSQSQGHLAGGNAGYSPMSFPGSKKGAQPESKGPGGMEM